MAFNPVSVSVGNWIFFSKHLFWTAENTISGHFVEFSEIQRYNNFMNKHEKKFVNAWKKFRVAWPHSFFFFWEWHSGQL